MLPWITFLNFRGYSERTEIPEEDVGEWMQRTDRKWQNTKIKNPYKVLKNQFSILTYSNYLSFVNKGKINQPADLRFWEHLSKCTFGMTKA